MKNIKLLEYKLVNGDIVYLDPPDWAAIKAAGYAGVYIPASHDCHDNPTLTADYWAAKGAGLEVGYYVVIADGKTTYGAQVNDLRDKMPGKVFALPPCILIVGNQRNTGHQLRGDLEFTMTDFLTKYPLAIALNGLSMQQIKADTARYPDGSFFAMLAKTRLWLFSFVAQMPAAPGPWPATPWCWGADEAHNWIDYVAPDEPEPTNPTPEPDPDADVKPDFMISRDDLLKVVDALRKTIEAL